MRKKEIIFAVFFCVLLFGCKPKETMPDINKLVKKGKGRVNGTDNLKEAVSLLDKLKKRNPFNMDAASGISQDKTVDSGLKGIMWDSNNPVAIIGDKVVSEGDVFDNKKVVKINKDSVVLEENGNQLILELEKPGG